jgi:CDGSH-type Zn-finger protein
VVEGAVELVDPEGNPIPTRGTTLFLCRCGASADKPFCDSWTAGTPTTCARLDAERVPGAGH